MTKNKTIEIFGGIGTGKSTLASAICSSFNGQLVEEKFEGNPFLEPYLQHRDKYAFESQSYFCLMFLHQQKEITSSAQNNLYVFDSTRLILKAHYLMMCAENLLRPTEENMLGAMLDDIDQFSLPDILIVTQTPLDIQINRIKERNRGFEQTINQDFFETHNRYLQIALNDFKEQSKNTLFLNADNVAEDFRNDFSSSDFYKKLAVVL